MPLLNASTKRGRPYGALLVLVFLALLAAGCSDTTKAPGASAPIRPAGVASPTDSAGGSGGAVDCWKRLAPAAGGAEAVTVVLMTGDSAVARRGLNALLGGDDLVLIARYDNRSGTLTDVATLDLAGQGPNDDYAAADAAVRRRCAPQVLTARLDGLGNVTGGDALAAIPWAIDRGRQLTASGAVRVVILDAGHHHGSGFDLSKADLGSPELVRNAAEKHLDAGLLNFASKVRNVSLEFVSPGEGAPNGIVADQRRAFFSTLCDLISSAVPACTVTEEVVR